MALEESTKEDFTLAFDIRGFIEQKIKIVHPDYDKNSIISGLESEELTTSTGFTKGAPLTIFEKATGVTVAKVLTQDVDGECEHFCEA